MPVSRRVGVIGLGNRMRRDDRAGLEAVAQMANEGAFSVRAHEGEVVDLLDLWPDADVIVLVDAVQSGSPAGTIHRFDVSTDPLPATLRPTSSHVIGLGAAIELSRSLGTLPARVVFYGVEGIDFAAGTAMSAPVAAAIAALVEAVRAEALAAVTSASTDALAQYPSRTDAR